LYKIKRDRLHNPGSKMAERLDPGLCSVPIKLSHITLKN